MLNNQTAEQKQRVNENIVQFRYTAPRSGWTQQRVETLVALWGEGLSASKISAQMGGITRSAVIGKVHRLNLPERVTKTSLPNVGNRTPRLRIEKRSGGKAKFINEIPLEDLPSVVDLQIPAEQRKTLQQLTAHTCRWPVGEVSAPDFFFCGAEPFKGRQYCAGHLKRSIARPPHNRPKKNSTWRGGF